MTSSTDISTIVRLVKNEVKKFEEPVITQVSHKKQSPYQVLISCLLSLRTQDKTTAKASKRLFSLAKTSQEMVKLSNKQIEKAIYPVGFFRRKAKIVKEISRVLIQEYNGKVPETFEELMKLKGVGRKTANIVMVYAHKKEGLPIDTHCHRIPNRLGWVNTKTPEKTEDELRKILPKRYWNDFNDTFVTFGQNVCRPIGPHCSECPVKKYCRYYKTVYLPKAKKVKYLRLLS